MPYIEITDISKSYVGPTGEASPVLERFSLSVNRGELISIFGPNGCGKSTLLNIVADLLPPDSGSVSIDGKRAADARIGFVFQKYSESLFPWLRNVDNIAFSLDSSSGSRRVKRMAVRSFVKDMGLEALPLDQYPYQCSAGQQQLVALARELIYKPDVLLMDEPFVSLDYDRRLSQQEHLLNTWARTKSTILLVSHDIDEAIYLADRVVLLSQRPARIAAVFAVGLPRPRTIDTLASEAFFRLKAPILRAFMEIIRT